MENTDNNNELNIINNIEDQGFYLADAIIDSKIITKVKNKGKFNLSPQELVKTSVWDVFNRENIIYYGIMQGEQSVRMKEANFKFQAPIVKTEQVKERIKKIKENQRKKISMLHINSIQIVIRSTFREGLKTPIELIVEDNRLLKEKRLGSIEGDLGYGIIKFNVAMQYPIPLSTQTFDNCISISCNFKDKELMRDNEIPFVVNYRVAYALTNSSLSMKYHQSERLYTEKIFEETSTMIKNDEIHQQFLRENSTRRPMLTGSSSNSGLSRSSSMVIREEQKRVDKPISEISIQENNQLNIIQNQVLELGTVVRELNQKI